MRRRHRAIDTLRRALMRATAPTTSALLASIESAFGSHHDFNRKVRLVGAWLLEAVTSPTQRRRPHSLQKGPQAAAKVPLLAMSGSVRVQLFCKM